MFLLEWQNDSYAIFSCFFSKAFTIFGMRVHLQKIVCQHHVVKVKVMAAKSKYTTVQLFEHAQSHIKCILVVVDSLQAVKLCGPPCYNLSITH